MIVYLNDNKIKIKELIQDNYSDLDIMKEKPIAFKKGNYYIIAAPVRFIEHDEFLQHMASLMVKYYEIFQQIDLLTSFNYNKPGIMEQVINSLAIFQASKKYKKFMKDVFKFCAKWSCVAKESDKEAKRNKRLVKKVIMQFNPSEIIYLLYVLFVFNFDIVKKNTIQFLAMFTGQEIKDEQWHSGTLSAGTSKKVLKMPQYSENPLPRSVLDLLEEQSRQ